MDRAIIKKVTFLLLPVVFWLSACTTIPDRALKHLESASVCCTKMSQFHYEPIQAGSLNIFDINQKSEVFEFDSGMSYLKAIVLPEKQVPYSINIKSYILGGTIYDSYIFYPYIFFLDEGYKQVGDAQRIDLKIEEKRNQWGPFESLPTITLAGRILIDNPRYKYLVIHTTPQEISSTTSFLFVTHGLAAVAAMLGMVQEGFVEFKHSPIGKISLTLENGDKDVSDYLTLYQINAYKFMGKGARKGSGILSAAGHFSEDHQDESYGIFYFNEENEIGVKVEVTQHAGSD